MPYYNESTRQRVADLVIGLRVDRPAEAVAITATPGDPYFDVHGLCLVTGLIGICTVAAGGANTMSFEFNPDGTAATSAITATTDLGTASVDGDVVVVVGAPATGPLGGNVGVQALGTTAGKGLVMYEGVIGLVATAALGTWSWVLLYVPLSDGAYIDVV